MLLCIHTIIFIPTYAVIFLFIRAAGHASFKHATDLQRIHILCSTS